MSVIKRDPNILSGEPCFDGTRVPIKLFFNTIRRGASLHTFIFEYPSVTFDMVLRLIEEMEERIEGPRRNARD